MSSTARLAATVIGVAALLTPAVAQAAPDPTKTFEVRYNPGDSDPAHGPNSFVITDHRCGTQHIRYRIGDKGWDESIQPRCDETISVSVAPLGPNEYPLKWRYCFFSFWRKPPIPHLFCGDFHETVVRTT
ncbi:hypothetical protein GCM10022243_36660 [Saccharothrix violaceirubra]|uniref:Secreted protein n=1 Tax=Saccharothrix violaceirubra TaxID=413306 RepID=A0A7W7T4I2_9PSEU|nr:hypothetical protein [Saccharothrix violaceirubra]MBB4966418.1 hypothetical protein [Saccharothrix violaceirubra]